MKKGYDPLGLRYLILNSQYKKGLSFSWEALDSAQVSLKNLRALVSSLKQSDRNVLSAEKESRTQEYRQKFIAALSDDLNAPQALAVLWEMLKSNIPSGDKYDLALSFDEILGLNLKEKPSAVEIPDKIKKLLDERKKLREEKKFGEADNIRRQIEDAGYKVEDEAIG